MASRRGKSFALWTSAAFAVWAAGCATPAPTGRPAAPVERPAAAPAHVFASLSEAEPVLMALEDTRGFDAATLQAAAKSPDASARARAALCLGRLGDDRGRPLLVALLSDPEASVRALAAFAAGIGGDPSLTSELTQRLADADRQVAAAAAKAVGQLAAAEGRDALTAAISGAASPEPKAAILQALWRYADSASTRAVSPFALDPDPKVRAAAIYALARKPLETSLSALTVALGDADPDTAAIAARALGLIGKKESLEPLAAALDSAKAPLVTNALVALEAILEKNPGSTLSEARKNRVLALAGDVNPNFALPALRLLRQFVAADREALRRVWAIAMTGEGRRRQVALDSLVAALRERAKDPLDRAVESPEARLRAAGAESLAFLPAAAAAPYRAKLAEDREALVRLALLSSLKTPEAVRESRAFVDRCLADPDAGVRASAIEALALTNDAAVLPTLADAVARSRGQREPDVPIAAIAAAEKMRGEAAARAVVEAAYKDPRPLVARLARRALVRSFRAEAAALPAPVYPGRAAADYASLLAEAKRPWVARVESARGSFTIRLLGSQAPNTVVNFIALARKPYFDGIAIHRVVPNFVVQDGDPTGTGNGGPGYEIRDEINPVPYGRGTVGMALSGPDTGGSQWFLTHSPQPHLDGVYTVFGQIVAGQEVVDRIEQGDRVLRVTVAEMP
jgi:cyclophilin family peptidyl-prolyl cis-trans isomerase/HEAT repeat protein